MINFASKNGHQRQTESGRNSRSDLFFSIGVNTCDKNGIESVHPFQEKPGTETIPGFSMLSFRIQRGKCFLSQETNVTRSAPADPRQLQPLRGPGHPGTSSGGSTRPGLPTKWFPPTCNSPGAWGSHCPGGTLHWIPPLPAPGLPPGNPVHPGHPWPPRQCTQALPFPPALPWL